MHQGRTGQDRAGQGKAIQSRQVFVLLGKQRIMLLRAGLGHAAQRHSMVLPDILFVFLLQHNASFICRWPHPCDMGQHNHSAKGFASTCLTAVGCACLFLLLSASSISAASIRGVQPSLLSVYTSDTDKFKCLDGSKSLQRSRVNDDYCDCLDGSDEPG